MKVLMPQLGETVTEGTVSKWHKKIGDVVKIGEILFEIETDKTSMEIPATSDGKLLKIHVSEGETSSVGAIVAIIIGDNEEDEKETEQSEPIKEVGKSKTEDQKEEKKTIIQVPEKSNTDTKLEDLQNIDTEAPNWFTYLSEVLTPTDKYNEFVGNINIKLTPLAKRIVANERLNLNQLADYFKNHKTKRVSRKQIDDYIALQSTSIQSGDSKVKYDTSIYDDKASINRIRRTTGKRLSESWPQIPQAFQAVEVNFSNLDKIRLILKEKNNNTNFKISYLSFVSRAIVMAINKYPFVNGSFNEKELLLSTAVNLAIAVDLNFNGLIVPVIKNAEKNNLLELNGRINDLVSRAQNNKLSQEEYFGGTYTISNNGSMGTYITAPIVNPPQVAIMSFDGVNKKPVIIEDKSGDTIGIRKVGILGQSFDHRAFDGAYAASFLKEVSKIIEEYDWQSEI
jgi:2-oxoglutarate dehydrogenase E2 component (dihydrolipoamide succinyltransferase)